MKKIVVSENKHTLKDSKINESQREDFVENEAFALEREGNRYVTKNAQKYKAEFASDRKDEALVTIHKDNHFLKMNFLGKKKRISRVIDSPGKVEKNKVTYEEIEEGLDVSYQCEENKIKESLIIKSKQDAYEYDFDIDIGELTPILNEKENILELVKGNRKIYRILSPYMEDSHHQRSDDCSYEIEQSGSVLTLHLHCDAKWMNDEDRAFPIVVDPTIEIETIDILRFFGIMNGAEQGESTYTVSIGESDHQFYAAKVLIKTNEIIDKTKGDIDSAILRLFIRYRSMQDNAFFLALSEGNIIDRPSVSVTSAPQYLYVDITKAFMIGKEEVELIICSKDDPYLISGNVIPPEDETRLSRLVVVRIADMYTDGSPIISVNYERDRIRTKRIYKEYMIGDRDTSKVFLSDGQFCHEHDDTCRLQENCLSVSLKHRYKCDASQNNGFGTGWTTNLHQNLIKTKEYNYAKNGVRVKYIDGEGNTHDFYDRFYYVRDNIKYYITKENVYLDTDYEYKYLDENGTVFEAKYETTNEEDLQLVQGSFINEHPTKIRTRKKYFLSFGYGKREISVSEDIERHYQFYYLKPGSTRKYYVLPSEVLKNPNGTFHTVRSDTQYLFLEGYGDSMPLVKQNNQYGFIFKCTNDNGWDTEVFCPLEEQVVSEEYEALDLYRNDEIANIDEQILSIEDYIRELEISKQDLLQTIQNSYDSVRLSEEIYVNQAVFYHGQRELKEKYNRFYDQLGTDCEFTIIDSYGFDIDEEELTFKNAVDSWKEEQANKYLDAFARLYKLKSDDITRIYEITAHDLEEMSSNASSVNMMHSIERYEGSFEEINRKLSNYQTKLENLKYRRTALIEEQKKQVNDFIVDPEGNTLGFDGYGRLILIQDTYGNEIHIEFGYEEDNNGKMLSVYTDKQSIRLNYDKDTGLLTSLVDPQGKKTYYAYSEEKLIEIRRDNEKELPTRFQYDAGLKVLIPNISAVDIQVSNEKVHTVQIYKYKSEIGEVTVLSNTSVLAKYFQFSFQSRGQYVTTLILERVGNGYEQYSIDDLGNVLLCQDGKTNAYYEYDKDRIITELTYPAVNHRIEQIDTKAQKKMYSIDLQDYALPASNMMGVLFKTNSAYMYRDVTFQVRTKVETTIGDRVVTKLYETQYNNVLTQLIQPLCISSIHANKLEITIESDDANFEEGIFSSVELICLSAGAIHEYDDETNTVTEFNGSQCTVITLNEDKLPIKTVTENIFNEEERTVAQYYYNSQNQLIYVEDNHQNVGEYFYDDKGNCIEQRDYNKKDASLIRVEKASYDDKGNIVSASGKIKNSDGIYPTEAYTYYPGTNLLSKVRGVNGESICYQYDFHTGEVLSISSSSQGMNNATTFRYTYGLLTSLSHHGMKVDYAYDTSGRIIQVVLNGEVIQKNTYDENYNLNYKDAFNNDTLVGFSGTSITSIKGGTTVTIWSDRYDKIRYSNYHSDDSTGATKYTYDSKDRLTDVISKITYSDINETYIDEVITEYDHYDTVVRQEKKVNDTTQMVIQNTYDERHRYLESSDSIFSEENYLVNTRNTYDEDDRLKLIELRTGTEDDFTFIEQMNLDYDALGRVKHQNLHSNQIDLCHEYSYLQQDEASLDFISEDITKVKIQNGNQTTYLTETSTYEYDVNGNIVSINQDENQTRYFYDSLNRLIREDNPLCNKTIIYQYDKAGNILLKKTYDYTLDDAFTHPQVDEYIYDCDRRDRLIAYNNTSIRYDALGRPTTYKDNEYTWNSQNQLIQIFTQAGDKIEYLYDTNGIRRKKKVHDVETTFITNGSQILIMKEGSKTFIFRYILNKLVGFNYNDGSSTKEYIYQRNIQGDILGIFDDKGNQVGGYVYDAYGNQTVTLDVNGIATLNPFRYRGYFYDAETELYYLQSRYYDPETGRFISPDDISYLDPETIGGLNLYVYCLNNPIMMIDPTGCVPEWLKWLGIGLAVVGAVLVIGAVTVLTCGVGTLAGTMAGAVIYGAAQGIAIGAAVGTVAGGIVGGIATDWSTEGILIGMGIGLGAGAIIGGVIGGFAGASSFTANSAYISQYGGNVKEVLSAYKGNPRLKVLNSNTTAYRTWGGTSGKFGHWISPKNYGFATRRMLSLPPGNTATNTSSFLISKGSTVLSGKVAAMFGQAGGGIQWWIGLL